jgi:hypothetical protein
MPWCETCARYWTPTSMAPDGGCPTCGHVLSVTPGERAAEEGRAPWHFKLLLAAVVAYLGWRAAQGVAWVFQHV